MDAQRTKRAARPTRARRTSLREQRGTPAGARHRDGYALMTVVVFLLVITIGGITFFGMASHETEGALYRESSSEAFLLADGAVERARAKFLEDRTWRAGWTNEAAGRGDYDATITDTVFAGEPNAVQILTTGRVEQATRMVEVMARVPPTAFDLGLLVVGDADVNGNLCLNGNIHVNGDADFGPGDNHLACGEYTDGFELTPPPIYTDPDHYPDATYYYVRAKEKSPPSARIFDRDGNDITAALGDSLTDVMSYNAGQKTFHYDFDDNGWLTHYFDEATGIFAKAAGDVAVVVNFGETPLVDPPGVDGVSRITLDGNSTSTVHTTIINTRFTGTTVEQRVDTTYWRGGLTAVKQIILEPHYGVGLVVHDFQKVGGAHAQVGTVDWPAFVYVTQDVVGVNSNFELIGAIVTLGDWNSTGGPDITFDDGFLENFPDWLVDDWTAGVSGTLKILRWRELASGT